MLIVLAGSANSLSAGGFADSFRNFVLNEDRPAGRSVTDAQIVLPENTHAAACMECHDGSKAKGVALKHADSEMQFIGHVSVNHPVGMNYRDYADRDPVMFVSPAQLDRRILLEDGEVTCISCHALKARTGDRREGLIQASWIVQSDSDNSGCMAEKGQLTTGRSSTKLCLSCHAL